MSNTGFDASRFVKEKWLKAPDVTGSILTVQKAYEHEFKDGTIKPVIEFLEIDQCLVCNKTRTLAMIEAFGTNGADWVGKRVQLSTAPTSMGDTIVITSAEGSAEAQTEVSFA